MSKVLENFNFYGVREKQSQYQYRCNQKATRNSSWTFSQSSMSHWGWELGSEKEIFSRYAYGQGYAARDCGRVWVAFHAHLVQDDSFELEKQRKKEAEGRRKSLLPWGNIRQDIFLINYLIKQVMAVFRSRPEPNLFA